MSCLEDMSGLIFAIQVAQLKGAPKNESSPRIGKQLKLRPRNREFLSGIQVYDSSLQLVRSHFTSSKYFREFYYS